MNKIATLLLFTCYLLLVLFPIPSTLSPVYAGHCPTNPAAVNIPLAQYCERATNTRWQDMRCDESPQHLPLGQCSATEDCVEFPNPVDARHQLTECRPIGAGAPTGLGTEPAGLTQIENLVQRIIRLSTGLAFVALFVVLLWAGIKFLTSGGDPKALQSAQQTVVWALLGILFLAIAWLVLQLVAAFTGIPGLRIFDIRVLCVPGNPIC